MSTSAPTPRPPRPDPSFNVAGIPDELRARATWINWRPEWRDAKGKWDKPPYCVNSTGLASTKNPGTWSRFDIATASASRMRRGIGYVFSGDVSGIDLDHVIRNGKLIPEAAEILRHFKTYAEVSPSGDGVHIYLFGQLPGDVGGRKQPMKTPGSNIEAYSHGRYFTVTGRALAGAPPTVEDCQDALDRLVHEYFPPEAVSVPIPAPLPPELQLEDDELLKRAEAAGNGEKFKALWAGDLEAYEGDHSSADLALCCMLAFWCRRDADRIDRLFRKSQLMRTKWDEKRGVKTYGQRTVGRAVEKTAEVYEPREELCPVCSGPEPCALHLKAPPGMDPDHPDAEREPDEPTQPSPRRSVRLVRLADALKLPPAVWRVYGLLSGLTLLWATAGMFKSFTAASLAVAVAAGRPWFGRRVAGGGVIYIVGEGGHAMASRRLRAAAQALGVQADDLPLYLTESGAVNLSAFDGVQAQELLAEAGRVAATVGPVALLVTDTVSRCAPGDENSQETMQRFVATLDALRERLGCDVLGVHHSGITGNRPRGSTVLEYAADVNLEIRRRKSDGHDRGTYPMELYAHKRKEAEDHIVVETFDAVRVDVTDDDGNPERDEAGNVRTTLVLKNGKNLEGTEEAHQSPETTGRRSPAKERALGALLTLGPTFSRPAGLEAVRTTVSKASAYRFFDELTVPVGDNLYRVKER